MELSLQLLRGFWVGLWLGILSDDHLATLDEESYRSSDFYRSSQHNLGGLFVWEREVVERTFPSDARVLVLGVGAGREAFALEKMGFETEAYECNEELRRAGAELADAHGLTTTLRQTDRDAVPETDEQFGAAIIGWGMFTQVRGRETRARLLSSVGMLLEAGAPVLLSFLSRSERSASHRVAALVGKLVRLLTGVSQVEEGDFLQPQYGHYFTAREVERELTEAGFNGVEVHMAPYPHALAWNQAE